MIVDEKIIKGLNGILEKNIDAEKGFRNAAADAENTSLTTYFYGKADQRRRFSEQLKTQIIKLGGELDDSGSIAGTLHRRWMDVKAAFSLNDDEAVLDACETGERAAMDEYDEFLQHNVVPVDVRNILIAQRRGIARSLRQIEALEEQFDKD